MSPLEHIKKCLEVSWELRCNLTTTGKYYFSVVFWAPIQVPLTLGINVVLSASLSLFSVLLSKGSSAGLCQVRAAGQGHWLGLELVCHISLGNILLSPFLRKCRWCDWAVSMFAAFWCIRQFPWALSCERQWWVSLSLMLKRLSFPVRKLNNLFNIVFNNETKLLTISIKYLILTN